ncbi:enoyl-CoA hydratase/isomerase family protein [Scytonema sp. NUACC26]|uniref:enoyl-CoA hydratase/isomerase family protein n=1 Tax=Scytonema sp. NUACC26 TaxID=3140176 RepID=UPI0034DB7CDE
MIGHNMNFPQVINNLLRFVKAWLIKNIRLNRYSIRGYRFQRSMNDNGSPSMILPVTARIAQSIMYITLDRPAVLNAINLEMVELLQQHLIEARQSPAIRAIVITGKGRAFCAGGDLKFAVQANPDTPGDSFLALTAVLHQCIEEIRTMPKPVIASINGVAAGAGLFLALACDLRIMAKSAYLKQSNTSYGLCIPAGGTFTLPRLVGIGRAMEIIMLDRPLDAKAAQDLGLVNRIVPNHKLIENTQILAKCVAKMPIETLGRMKQLIDGSFYHTLNEQLAAESQAMAISANSTEGREGLTAFLQKRRPVFK